MAVELYQEPAVPATASTAKPSRSRTLKGQKKAAVLLVSLGADRAGEVLKHLREEEIEALSVEMAKLGPVDPTVTHEVLEELAAGVTEVDSLLAGGVDYARDVLERAVGGDRAAEIVGRMSSVLEMRPFEFLRRTPADQIIGFLHGEAPQTVALVVANLHTTLAAQVLSRLPEDEQADVAIRVARMGETNPEVIKQVEQAIRARIANTGQQEYAATGGAKSLAEILNHADRPTEQNVLDSLTSADEELGAEVRRLLFVFADIVKLDDRSIQLVLREADQKDLALALRGVSTEVKDRLLSNMSERGAQMLLEEIEFQPPQRKSVVEEAQGRIVAVIRRLEEAGAIVLSRSDADDVL